MPRALNGMIVGCWARQKAAAVSKINAARMIVKMKRLRRLMRILTPASVLVLQQPCLAHFPADRLCRTDSWCLDELAGPFDERWPILGDAVTAGVLSPG